MDHCAITLAAALDSLAVNTRSWLGCKATCSGLLSTVIVDIFEVERVEVTRNVAKDGEADIDKHISTTSCYGINAKGREEESDEDDQNN